jgi:hypothetical protein
MRDELDDEKLHKHFGFNDKFMMLFGNCDLDSQSSFRRLAQATHDAGLDCWFVKGDSGIRASALRVCFGRKHSKPSRCYSVILTPLNEIIAKMTIHNKKNPQFLVIERGTSLTDDLVVKIEQEVLANLHKLQPGWFASGHDGRVWEGMWPDEIV